MKYFWTLLLLTGTMNLFAQISDDCADIIDLGVAPACDQTIYTNVNATASDIGIGNEPTCFNGGGTQRDVWFAFTTSDTIFDYTISVIGIDDGGNSSITNPQLAFYRGDCIENGLAELFCVSAELGEQSVEIDIPGLTPNVTYYIRINDYSSSATSEAGTFQLCVDEVSPSSTIDENNSTACSGVLFDSGGEDGDYSEDENHTFTICPTEFHNCIIFDLAFYNTEYEFDFIRFYDGDDTNGTLLANLTGGGVDYQVQASSGCLTVEFISDALNNFEGFEGSWTCTTAECIPSESVMVFSNPTEQEIIENLTTPQTTISNIVLNCQEGAAGTFQANELVDLNMEKGIILTSGLAELAEGPNDFQDSGFEHPPFFFDDLGDEDLNTLSPDDPSMDACVLEFDVFVATNELRFDYVFGSEEYPEYAPPNVSFNDIFAFLISGPGITGSPDLNGQENIAVLPDGTPVTINTINSINNWEYYKDNQSSNSIEYDGLIVDQFSENGKMTARRNVAPCNTYHLKLAIADRGDEIFDSGVFISELKGGTPDVSVNFNSGIDYLLENCTSVPDELIISLNSPQEDSTSYIINIGGTATQGIDYTLDVPMVITFPPGVTSLSFPIAVLSDMETEMTETIDIALSSDFGCGVVNLSTISIEIRDQLDIQILTGADTAFVCQDSSIILEVSGAATYFWTPVNIISDPTSPITTVTTNTSQYVYVEGTVGASCTDYDSVYIKITNPEIVIETPGPINICEGEEVLLSSSNNVNNTNLMWTPDFGLDDTTIPNPTASPSESIKYVASVALGGCVASDTISFVVDNFDFPELTTTDTTLCQSYPVQLAEMIETTNTIYSWTPAEGLDASTISGPIATPSETTTYTLLAVSESGNCIEEASVTVQVIEALVDIQAADTLEICLGDSIDISVNTSTNGAGLLWSPAIGLNSTTATTVTANPSTSTWYYTTLTTNECVVLDSIYVKVDSLPDNTISAIPEMDIYCQGDIVTLISGNVNMSNYPDIEYMWSPPIGALSELDNLNLALTATETTTYTRTITNGACMSSSSYEILVQPVIELIATPSTTLCAGETLQLEVFSENADDFEWSPEGQGLSCIECENPILTVQPTTTTYTVTANSMGCVMTDNVTITVEASPAYQFPADPVICLGNSITLNLNPNPVTTEYVWTSPDDPAYNSTEAAPTVMPTSTTTYHMIATTDCATIEDEVTIIVIEEATMTVSNDTTICENTNITLSANGTAPGDYSWTWGDNNTANGNEIMISQESGTVEYTVTYAYGNGCGTLTESVFVTANPFIVLDNSAIDISEDLIICDGDEFSLTADGNAEGTYFWTWEDNNSANTNTISPEHTAGDTISYFVTFTDEESCLISSDSVQVISTPYPDLTLTADSLKVFQGASVTLYANSTFENLTYQWSEGNSTEDTTIVNPFDNPTTYMVTITSEDGCSNTTSISIETEEAVGKLPNVFTPNGDSVNEFFNIISPAPFEVVEFRVYNRWGQLVYDNETPNTGWDGTFKDKLSPSDVYVFYVVYTINGIEKQEKGDVTLVR